MPALEKPLFAAVALFLLLVASFTPAVVRFRQRRRLFSRLHESWGQPLRKNRESRPVAARTPRAAPPGTERLDDATWSDLDMERVFTRIDRTLSAIGAQTLHRILRCPPVEHRVIDRHRALVRAVAEDTEARVRMQVVLAQLGDQHGWEAWFALTGALPHLPGPMWLLRLLPYTMLATLAAGAYLDNLALVIAGLVLAFVLPVIHTLANRRIGHHLSAVADLRRVLDAAVALSRSISPALRSLVDDVIDHVAPLRRSFGYRAAAPRPNRFGEVPELFAEYWKAFALSELLGYQRAWQAIARSREDYERVLDIVGEVDAALSIAYLRTHDEDLRECEIDPDCGVISSCNLRHPLVGNAVGNDIEIGPRGLLVTGSNMTGKSTLLRAIGVNLVLARSIGLVAADRWHSRPLRLATAMGAHDDLAAGVSTYRAEVDRVHELVRRAEGDHLFLLDETFRGTNPHERIAATAAVLRYLARRDLVVAATHDRELCDLLDDAFDFGHFTEEVEDDDVIFDYRLRPGALNTTNAIAILERAGFPDQIVHEARRTVGQETTGPARREVVRIE